ncbi:MAG TPA: hypothetical protein VFM96_13680 [Gaiellaceae bacterium]|nr:hypothetical protein [Gaiellaceae bacterium]
MAAHTSRGNRRASAAVVLGAIAAAALPAGIVLANQSARVSLLAAAWAVPVAAVCGVSALLLARGARTQIRVTLDRAGGHRRVRAAVYLGIAGICFALSGAIAVGFYELLLRLEG